MSYLERKIEELQRQLNEIQAELGKIPLRIAASGGGTSDNSISIYRARLTEAAGTGNIIKGEIYDDAGIIAEAEEWVVETEYAIGDVVVGTDDKNYVCIAAHTAATGNKPVTGEDPGWEGFWELREVTIYTIHHKTDDLNTALPILEAGKEVLICQLPYNNGGTVEQRWYIVDNFMGREAYTG